MRSPRRGFALLMVLVLLAMLATVLTLRTRQMMEQSLVWDVQAREVQLRWAQRSVAEALAPRAPALLGLDEKARVARRPPRATWDTSFALGSVSVSARLSDEQAKLNLLTLPDESTVRRAVTELIAGAGANAASRVRLRPLAVPPLRPDVQDADDYGYLADAPAENDDGRLILINRPGQYVSFGQLLDHPQPGELMGRTAGRGLASGFTLWGDGRLNLGRADPSVLRVMLSFGVGPKRIEQILVAARKPGVTVDQLFASLPPYDAPEEDDYAQVRLTDTSAVQGLWVRARSAGSAGAGSDADANTSAAFYVIEGPGRPRRVQTW